MGKSYRNIQHLYLGGLELPRLISGGYHERCDQHKYIHAHCDFNQQFDDIMGYTILEGLLFQNMAGGIMRNVLQKTVSLSLNQPFDGDTSRDVEPSVFFWEVYRTKGDPKSSKIRRLVLKTMGWNYRNNPKCRVSGCLHRSICSLKARNQSPPARTIPHVSLKTVFCLLFAFHCSMTILRK